MEGMEVFNFVARNVPKRIKTLMNDSSISPEEIDWLVLHQANQFMLKQVARSLKIPLEKVPISINKYGNSSSSTIPITICSEMKNQVENSDSLKLLLCGFGAGLSIGAVCLNVNNVKCAGVIDYE